MLNYNNMTEEEILEHNKICQERLEDLYNLRSILDEGIQKWKNNIILPCKFCPYDGVYRCEACSETGFSGFNDANFLERKE